MEVVRYELPAAVARHVDTATLRFGYGARVGGFADMIIGSACAIDLGRKTGFRRVRGSLARTGVDRTFLTQAVGGFGDSSLILDA